MFRRLLQQFKPDRRIWIPYVVALAVAVVGALVICCLAVNQADDFKQLRLKQHHHSLPSEMVCLVPFATEQTVADSVASRLPVIRLREYAPDRYELLYWGNPVRRAYTYSVWSVCTGQSALLSAEGERELFRPLPVTVPRRQDGRLPKQPPVRLERLAGRSGDLYAARISVHDAATGRSLASALYLISGSES